MVNPMSEEEIYEEAKKRVKVKKDFYGHLTAYLGVNILLIVIWAVTGAGYPWFVFPLCGWGIGISIHFFQGFVLEQKTDKAAIEKEAEKIRRDQK